MPRRCSAIVATRATVIATWTWASAIIATRTAIVAGARIARRTTGTA